MIYKDDIKDNDAFIFELDNVLYPEKDYLLQVYYLFAQFIEYGEQIDAQGIIAFMNDVYLKEGHADIFDQTAAQFGLDQKYRVNFDLLHQNARLPLKLLMFAPVLSFMQEIHQSGKKLFLLADGDPLKQLNKIRQMEWNGVEQYLTVYFTEEIAKGSTAAAVVEIINKHALDAKKTMFIGLNNLNQDSALSYEIKFLTISKLLVS